MRKLLTHRYSLLNIKYQKPCCAQQRFLSDCHEPNSVRANTQTNDNKGRLHNTTQKGTEFNLVERFNARLRQYAHNEQLGKMDQTLLMMQKQGVQPNLESYCNFFNVYAKRKQSTRMNSLLDALLSQGFSPGDVYNIMIKSSAAGKLDSLKEILHSMNTRHILPTVNTFHPMLTWYATSGKVSQLKNAIELMKENGIPLTQEICNMTVVALCKANDFCGIITILEDMHLHGLQPTNNMYNEIMDSLERIKDPEKVEELQLVKESNGSNTQL